MHCSSNKSISKTCLLFNCTLVHHFCELDKRPEQEENWMQEASPVLKKQLNMGTLDSERGNSSDRQP